MPWIFCDLLKKGFLAKGTIKRNNRCTIAHEVALTLPSYVTFGLPEILQTRTGVQTTFMLVTLSQRKTLK